MKTSLYTRLLLVAALCGLSVLSACTSDGSNTHGSHVKYSSGTPVNPDADPGGQGVAGSRSTGANNRDGSGRQ